MFVVSKAEAAAIRIAYEQRGEFSAAVELRRLFPGIADNGRGNACGRLPAGSRCPSRYAPPDCEPATPLDRSC